MKISEECPAAVLIHWFCVHLSAGVILIVDGHGSFYTDMLARQLSELKKMEWALCLPDISSQHKIWSALLKAYHLCFIKSL